jgi:multisubunit Na+/H+ antiporter MnhF subunit
MFQVALVIHVFLSTTLTGSAVVLLLVRGPNAPMQIVAAAAGFVAVIPASVLVARRLAGA